MSATGFPTQATTRTYGPATAVILQVGSDNTESPLVLMDSEETVVWDMTDAGIMRTIGGWFFADIDSIVSGKG